MRASLERNSINNKISNKIKRKNIFCFKMISPMLLIFLVLGVFPLLFSIILSLYKWRLNLPHAPKFVGLANYIDAFSDYLFLESLAKTAYYVVIIIIFSITIGFGFALLLNNEKIKKRGTILILSLFPWAVPLVVGALMWKWIFDGNYGVLNFILTKLRIIDSYRWWFQSSEWVALTFVAIVNIWRNAPFAGLIFFAGLQNIPRSLYEAASIDGATSFQKFKFITLPAMSVILMTILILLTTWTLKSFDTVFTLTGGGPANKTMITYMYVYKVAFSYLNMGYGAALGYLLTLIIIVAILIYYKKLYKPF